MALALSLAQAGHPVWLVDCTPWIGGSMHLLDRTFPTDSCGICLMSPVQPAYCPPIECGLDERVTILPAAQLRDVVGRPGDWQVMLEQAPQYVADEKCTRCGQCLDVCPQSGPALYEENLSRQRAIYRPPSRAVPNAPVIDMTVCVRCGRCVAACPTRAIDLDRRPATHTVNVGALVLCPGYHPFDARLKGEYGYGHYDNVITALQFERMTSPAGSTGGRIVRPSDGRPPQRMAFIHCVGSRDSTVGREYCSAVCCMYTAKQVAAAKDTAPDLAITVFHMDIRAGGKGYDRYFERVRSLPGVDYRRSMVSSVLELQQTKSLRLVCLGSDGRPREEDFGLVVLGIGLSPSQPFANALADKLGLVVDRYGFARPAQQEGVFVGGAYREPMDIPDVAMDAARLAGEVIAFHTANRAAKPWLTDSGKDSPLSENTSPSDKTPLVEQQAGPPRVGVFIQRSDLQGAWRAEGIDWDDIARYACGLHGVVAVEQAGDGRQGLHQAIAAAISAMQINRVVVLAYGRLLCGLPSGRAEPPLEWDEDLALLGLPPDAVEWVDLQDGCAAVHQEWPALRQVKARAMLAMAVSRLAEDRTVPPPAREKEAAANSAVLVIGGGPAGMSAAARLARLGNIVHLVERSGELGGQLTELRTLQTGEDPAVILERLRAQVQAEERIHVYMHTEVRRIEGWAGHMVTTLRREVRLPDTDLAGDDVADMTEFQVEHGAVVVAAGAQPVAPRSYGYGEHADIMTQRELEWRLTDQPASIPVAGRVVMIQCVESRDANRPYCSRICCPQAIKNALAIKRLSPQTDVVILYRDIRTPGLDELRYQEARQAGVLFLRYDQPDEVAVHVTTSGLQVELVEAVLAAKVRLVANWVVLSTGVEAANEELAQRLGLPIDTDGFFAEAHGKMRPLDFSRPGFYLCGLSRRPCTLAESMAQGEAAAARAALFLAQTTQFAARRRHIASQAVVNERLCSGCGLCVRECPYGARLINAETLKAHVIEALCLGCGACAAVCRNNASQQRSYEKARILSVLEAALD